MTRYSLRVTYLLPTRRARVRTVHGLTWLDVLALQNVLNADPSTLHTHATPMRATSTTSLS